MTNADTRSSSYSCCPPGSYGAPIPLPATSSSYFASPTEGTFVTVGPTQVPCYLVQAPRLVSYDETEEDPLKQRALILFPDVWGFRSRILKIADFLAHALSIPCLVVDFFRGETKDDHPDDMKTWFANIPYESKILPDLKGSLEFMKQEHGIQEFAAMGFCWGGWAIARACQDVDWKAVIAPHPSFKIESWVFGGNDPQLLIQQLLHKCPAVLLMPASNDPEYISQTHLSGRSACIVFEDMQHGWTTRGDLDADPKLQRDVTAALQSTVAFLQVNLFVPAKSAAAASGSLKDDNLQVS